MRFLLHHSSASHDLNRFKIPIENPSGNGPLVIVEVSCADESEFEPAQDMVHLGNVVPSSVKSRSDFCAGQSRNDARICVYLRDVMTAFS